MLQEGAVPKSICQHPSAECLMRQAETNRSKITKGGTEEVILIRRGGWQDCFQSLFKRKI